MTELERRALMGDPVAQRECTEKGVLLPCPLCGGRAMIEYGTVEPFEYSVFCGDCGVMPTTSEDEQVAGLAWNTRPAPPIGRCVDCIHYEFGACLKIYDDGHAHPESFQHRKPTDFCSYFNPKERE